MKHLLALPLLISLPGCIIHTDACGDGDRWCDDDFTYDDDWQDDDRYPGDDGPDDRDGDGVPDDSADVVDSGVPADSGDSGRDTDDTGTVVVPGAVTLDPAEGSPGEVLIVGLATAAGGADLTDLSEVLFFGTGAPDVLSLRADSPTDAWIALSIPANAAPGPQDLLLRFDNAPGIYLDGAFEVLAPTAPAP